MIVKFRKTPGHFITIDRAPIDADASISFKAKGILTYLMGRPDDWKPRIEEIASHSCEKKESVRSGVKELQKAGYIELRRIKDEKTNRWAGWEWRVTDTLLQTTLPCEEIPKHKKQVTDESPKPKNRVSGKEPVNGESDESPKPNFPYYGESSLLLKKTENKKDQEIKRREREEKATRAKSPQEEIYCEVFGEQNFAKLTVLQQQQLTILDDLELLRKTCQWWAGNNYKPNSIGRLCERYHEQEQKAKEEKSKPRIGQQESVFDRNLRILGIDPATLTMRQ